MSSYVSATTDLFTYGIPATAVTNFPGGSAALQAQCDAASNMADAYISPRMPVPVQKSGSPAAYPLDLVMRVAHVAAFMIICTRGFNPENPQDASLQLRHDLAIKYFEDIQRQRITPPWIVEPTSANYQMPNVVTGQQRGW